MAIVWSNQVGPRNLPNALTAVLQAPIGSFDINPVVVQKIIITAVFNATLGTSGTAIRGQIIQQPGAVIIADGRVNQVAGNSDGFTIRVEDTPAWSAVPGNMYALRMNGVGQSVVGQINIAHMTVETWP